MCKPTVGRPPDSEKWAQLEWIEQRRSDIATIGGITYDPFVRACADYVVEHFPKHRQTDAEIARLHKRMKNAREDWNVIERLTGRSPMP